MRRVEVKSRRRIFDDLVKIEEAELSFERYDGRISPTVRRLKFERGDSVAAIVIDRDKRCLYLTEQFKYPTLENGDGWIIEVVAGTQEADETAEDTLRREIEEEIGFAVEHAEPIATFYVSPGGTSERIFLFCAIVSGKSRRSAGGGVAAENEDIKVIEWPVSELLAKLDAKQLEDAKTIIAAYWIRDNYKRLADR